MYHKPDVVLVEDWHLYRAARHCISHLPDDLDLGIDEDGKQITLSSHILARAVASVFKRLSLAEGFYFKDEYKHAWVRISSHIIDVHPATIGRFVGATLEVGTWPFPANRLYRSMGAEEHREHYGDRFLQASFVRAVNIVTKELRRLAHSYYAGALDRRKIRRDEEAALYREGRHLIPAGE
jgi:hypothetical protein